MVRTRYGRYTKVAPQKHAQPAQSRAADHVGKRSGGSFHRFQDLPCELRLMVWQDALSPRLVAVKPRPCPKERDKARNLEISLIRGIPALLAVNQESRYLALRHYTWRFTIDLVIHPEGIGSAGFMVSKHQRARVVMSPDDTLGLFRCEPNLVADIRMTKFRVKVANEKRSPWRIHATTDAPSDEHWFKKVAVLGRALQSNLYIIKALNITPWDLDSMLHDRSTVTRTARSPHTKHKVLVTSAEMAQIVPGAPAPGFQAIVKAVDDRLQLEDRQEPDIMAYKLANGEHGQDWKHFLVMLSQRATRPHLRPAIRRPPRWRHMQTSR